LYNQGTNAKYLRIARENFIKIYITGGKIKLVYFTGGVKPYFIDINVNIFKIGKNNQDQVVYSENKIVFN
jgi:hypothetical protein